MFLHYRIRPGFGRCWSRTAGFVVLLGLATALAKGDESETPSAMESQPEGWTDLLAQAGPKLEGWTRGPLPATGRLNPRSQWSIDEVTGHLACQGDGGHEWLRWDKELGDGIFHVEWRFTSVPGKKGYNSGIYARNSADARIYHQAQTGDGSGGYLFGQTEVGGKPQRFNLSKQQQRLTRQAGRPVEHLRDHLQGQGHDPLGQRRRRQPVARLPGPQGLRRPRG